MPSKKLLSCILLGLFFYGMVAMRRVNINSTIHVGSRCYHSMSKFPYQIYMSVVSYCFLSVEEFNKYYRMPGWGKPLYEMKEAEIPKGEIPSAFDWRDKGKSTCTLCSTRCMCIWFT